MRAGGNVLVCGTQTADLPERGKTFRPVRFPGKNFRARWGGRESQPSRIELNFERGSVSNVFALGFDFPYPLVGRFPRHPLHSSLVDDPEGPILPELKRTLRVLFPS